MNEVRVNPVSANIRDSVSRIIYNMGFTSCDNTAHEKLCAIIGRKLNEMSVSCRILAENAGRSSMSTAPSDLNFFFRVNRVNFDELRDYMEQVGPFPPSNYEIHGDPLFGKDMIEEEVEVPVVEKIEVMVEKKVSFNSCSFLPIFDDMDDEDLGYASLLDSPPTPPIVALPPPPPPPAVPPVLSPISIPDFNPEVPPPVIPDLPNYMNPELPVKPPVDLPVRLRIMPFEPDPYFAPTELEVEESAAPKFTLKHTPAPINPSRVSKSFDLPRPLEKAASSSSLQEARMTKKRIMNANYEKRLRDEQMASVERKRRKKEKKEKKELEQPRIVLKFNKEEVAKFKFDQHPKVHTDINENKRKYKKRRAHCAPRASKQKPIPRFTIEYRNAKRGHLIKRIVVTTHSLIDGRWVPKTKTKFQNTRGLLSLPQSAQKNGPEIASIRLRRNSDGNYHIVD